MKTRIAFLTFGGLLAFHAPLANAGIELFEHDFNIDGTFFYGANPLPPDLDRSGFDVSTGLGTIFFTQNAPGVHYFGTFVDHQIDAAINTSLNEVGSVSAGAPAAGQSWEIDEPGFSFGNIYNHITSGLLDNSVGTGSPDNVSMALAWSFVLAPGESASIAVHVSETAPVSGFYLQHSDPDSNKSIYFSSSLSIGPTESNVPDGGATIGLLLVGLGTLGVRFHKARMS